MRSSRAGVGAGRIIPLGMAGPTFAGPTGTGARFVPLPFVEIGTGVMAVGTGAVSGGVGAAASDASGAALPFLAASAASFAFWARSMR